MFTKEFGPNLLDALFILFWHLLVSFTTCGSIILKIILGFMKDSSLFIRITTEILFDDFSKVINKDGI